MAGKQKIKAPSYNQGNKIKLPPSSQDHFEIDYPVFCFKYLDRDFHLDRCTTEEKAALANRLFILSQMSWTQIQLAGRHKGGSEKIARSSIRRPVPKPLTEDVEFLLAIRFDGMKPMVGHRRGPIFHVFFLDRDLSLYQH
jgi:hypothetical protein